MRRALARPRELLVDGIVIDQGAVAAAAGCETLGQHADDLVELGALEIAKGVCAPKEIEQSRLVPLTRRDLGDDLL